MTPVELAADRAVALGEGSRAFFETFGYLVVRDLFPDVGWVVDEFEATFADLGVAHDGVERSTIIPFVDHRPRLRALLDDPRIDALFTLALGPDWCFLSSDGNCYTGDTPWHPDGTWHHIRFVKMAFYLDPVDGGSGALRVIPGSHRVGDSRYAEDARLARQADTTFGIAQHEVPSVALASRPGDVVIFHSNLVHGSWGGSTRRRMFTMNACSRPRTPEQRSELRTSINAHARFWMDSMFTPTLLEHASPQARARLAEVLAHQGDLPALAAEARTRMDRPARH